MYDLAVHLTPEARQAIVGKTYHGNLPRTTGGRCAIAVGLAAMGLHVGPQPRPSVIATAIIAHRRGRMPQFNRHAHNPLWRWWLTRSERLYYDWLVDAARTFVTDFDSGLLLGYGLAHAVGIPRRPERAVLRLVHGEDGWHVATLYPGSESAPERERVRA